MVELKSRSELKLMREAGRIVARALELCRELIRPGVTTGDLDQVVEEYVRSETALPSFKGYHGFPASICSSINDEVVHGIPGDQVLNDGDIVSIDIGAFKNGFHGDAAVTFSVGDVNEESEKLLDTCKRSLDSALDVIRPGVPLWQVSAAIQSEIEAGKSFSIVEQYVGHGIGRKLHEDPQVPNYVAAGFRRGAGSLVLETGMVMAIEPMVNAGGKDVITRADRWTVVTSDGCRSTHFEHTVAVVDDGNEILTLP